MELKGKILPNSTANKALLSDLASSQENWMMNIKSFYRAVQSNNATFAGFKHVKFMFRSLILTLSKIIVANYCTWNCAQKIFYGNFLCLKVFKLKLNLCCYSSFICSGTYQKWSKHGIHRYIVCHALERYVDAIWGKTWAETLRKGKLWNGEWLFITG